MIHDEAGNYIWWLWRWLCKKLKHFLMLCGFLASRYKGSIQLAIVDHITSASGKRRPSSSQTHYHVVVLKALHNRWYDVLHFLNPGIMLPVTKIANRLRPHGVLVLVDGAHGPGQVDELDLASMGVDFYVASMHKVLLGPRYWCGSKILTPFTDSKQPRTNVF